MVTGSNHRTVLLVDDNPADLRTYSRALSEAGYRCITTLIGTDYFGIHHNESPALILLDRRLKSSLSAGSVAKILRDIFPSSPIVLFSMSADAFGEMDGLLAGFLQKGDPARVVIAVQNLVDKGSAREAARAAD